MLGRLLAWLPLVLILASGSIHADGTAPDVMVKNVTDEVLAILRQDKGIPSRNRTQAVTVIEKKVAPHFDFARMTSLAVGRAWQQAAPGQRAALTAEFRTLLVNTYANALSAYKGQTVSFRPSPAAVGSEVTVHSQINTPGAQPVALDYSLAKSGGNWKVFDVAIANVSLVTNYRSSFAEEIDTAGLDGLLKSLQDKNRHLKAAPSP